MHASLFIIQNKRAQVRGDGVGWDVIGCYSVAAIIGQPKKMPGCGQNKGALDGVKSHCHNIWPVKGHMGLSHTAK